MNKRAVRKAKQTEQKEIARIKLSNTQDFVASIVDGEKLHLRIFVKSDSYTGATRRGFRFYLFDENWGQFKKLVEKVDEAYNKIV